MEQVKLFETKIEYMGICISHDIEIGKSKPVGWCGEYMDEIKYLGKTISYLLVEKTNKDEPKYLYEFLSPDRNGYSGGPAYTDEQLEERLNSEIKHIIEKFFPKDSASQK